jgi:hypothetical protein
MHFEAETIRIDYGVVFVSGRNGEFASGCGNALDTFPKRVFSQVLGGFYELPTIAGRKPHPLSQGLFRDP